MRYQIHHTTRYQYSQAVGLGAQQIRLFPRSDGAQWLRSHDVAVAPSPTRQTYLLDALGNTCLDIAYDEPLTHWQIDIRSEVETTRTNPFDYISKPWAVALPLDYPTSVLDSLAPYLIAKRSDANTPHPAISTLASQLRQTANHQVSTFLTDLNQFIYQECQYQPRETGQPYLPETTLDKRSGTCRDYAVLFVAVCRAVGLAARFVSGYQEGDLDDNGQSNSTHDLHAWAEAYIPGAGWRGFDPTLGLAVADRHIAVAAAPSADQAAPVSGRLAQGSSVETKLESTIELRAL